MKTGIALAGVVDVSATGSSRMRVLSLADSPFCVFNRLRTRGGLGVLV